MKALFHGQITGVCPLVVGMNRVEVGRFDDFNVNASITG